MAKIQSSAAEIKSLEVVRKRNVKNSPITGLLVDFGTTKLGDADIWVCDEMMPSKEDKNVMVYVSMGTHKQRIVTTFDILNKSRDGLEGRGEPIYPVFSSLEKTKKGLDQFGITYTSTKPVKIVRNRTSKNGPVVTIAAAGTVSADGSIEKATDKKAS